MMLVWFRARRRSCRTVVAVAAVAALAVASCAEPTTSARRFALLDDIGQSDWMTVSTGGEHSCALKTNGNAYCWGSNRYGQLGTAENDTTCGTANARWPCNLAPRVVPGALRFSSISAGQRHTCGITVQSDLYCWGANDQGQLGDFVSGGPTLVRIAAALPWSQVSAGYTHTCAVRSDGAAFCWGSGERGQMGNGGFDNNAQPGRVSLIAPVASISAGQARTCARTNVGAVYCWGAIWQERQDGLELSRAQTTPAPVPASPAMAWVSVGSFSTCGTDRNGAAYCWEANPRGEVGDGSQTGSLSPQRVVGGRPFIQISAGLVQTCGVVPDGRGYCWGDNSFGELGVPAASTIERCSAQEALCSTKPVAVSGRQQFTEISTGLGSHTCGVTTRGNLYCWGLGASGQRGDGTAGGGVSTPLQVVEPR